MATIACRDSHTPYNRVSTLHTHAPHARRNREISCHPTRAPHARTPSLAPHTHTPFAPPPPLPPAGRPPVSATVTPGAPRGRARSLSSSARASAYPRCTPVLHTHAETASARSCVGAVRCARRNRCYVLASTAVAWCEKREKSVKSVISRCPEISP